MRSKRSKAWHRRKDIQRARKLIEHGATSRLYQFDMRTGEVVLLNEHWMVKVEHEV